MAHGPPHEFQFDFSPMLQSSKSSNDLIVGGSSNTENAAGNASDAARCRKRLQEYRAEEDQFQLHLALLEIQRFHNSLTRARSNLWPGMHPLQPPQSASHARKGVQKRTTERGRELAGAATGCALRAAYAGLRTAPNPLRLPLAHARAQMRLSHCPLKSVRCDQWRFALTVHPSLPSNFPPPRDSSLEIRSADPDAWSSRSDV